LVSLFLKRFNSHFKFSNLVAVSFKLPLILSPLNI
jgi:hypothetical protein